MKYFNFKRFAFFLGGSFLWLALVIAISPRGYCQATGLKFFKNYSRTEYGAQPQNWAIIQGPNRVIYVANQEGLLMYDGVSWRLMPVPNQTVRSLNMDDAGNLYIGGVNEIGRFIPDENGLLKYESLRDLIENNNQVHFSEVWKVYIAGDTVYFHSTEFLFLLDTHTRKIKTFSSENGFKASFMFNGILFLRDEKLGFHYMVNGKLRTIPGGERFALEKINMMAPFDNESRQFLLGSKLQGLFMYDSIDDTIEPFPTEADDYIKEKWLSHGIRLSTSPSSTQERTGIVHFALATSLGGLVVIDGKGKLEYKFDKASGLQDNTINYLYEDVEGNVWMALNKGISKIEYATPILFYDEHSNLPGLVLSVIKYHDDVYAGTDSGLYVLTASSPGKFRPVDGIPSYCFSLLTVDEFLLAATDYGVFLVKPGQKQITKQESSFLLPSQRDKRRVWVGTNQGLASLYLKPGSDTWEQEFTFKEITPEINSIIEDTEGNLWLGTKTIGVLRIIFPGNGEVNNRPAVTWYNSSHGLPEEEINVFTAAGHVVIASVKKGIFRYNEKTRRFEPDATLGDEYKGCENGKEVFRLAEDKSKRIWFHSNKRNFKAEPDPENIYSIDSAPLLRLPGTQVNAIYPDPDRDFTWFASNDGLFRYEHTLNKDYDHEFPTLIRDVKINEKSLFSGAYTVKKTKDPKTQRDIPLIEYQDRNIHFEFVAPYFANESATQYSHFLEGYTKTWSAWTSEHNIDYTNLDAGIYTFKVQARNVFEKPGREAEFRFRILPPWYLTWWALSLFSCAFFLAMGFVIKWRSGKLKREKHKLERIVKDRTREIEEQKRQLENQTLQLKEQSEKLKEMDNIKSRFFANISHEFRTPLTLIMGPLEHMLTESTDQKQQKHLNLMLRNSQRLLSLINQLLELSRFESGKMKLRTSPQNIVPFLEGILASFEPVTQKNELDLTLRAEAENMSLYFDRDKMEEVIINLLSNAIKFTPRGGKITLDVSITQTEEENFPAGYVTIALSDTGPGIPRDQLTHVFDRFYQSDTTYEHHLKGSGIGLSIARELVELHHGKIDVHSHEGKGTEFIIRLPLGAAHLQPEEIAAPPAANHNHRNLNETPGFLLMDKDQDDELDTGAAQTGGENREQKENGRNGRNGRNLDLFNCDKNIILVVEDSADVREYIKVELEPLYSIVEAADGREGLQKALEFIPDLIISDVMMPGTDGYELCRELKNNIATSHIPIILLTAKASEESIIKGLETGVDDYITKPFNTRILCVRIKNLIDLRAHLQQTLKREMTRQPVKISMSSNDKLFIKRFKKVIDDNIADTDFNVTQMCKELDMSQPTLYRKVFALTGESPTEFIRSYRLKQGAELLKNNAVSVLEVALEVGFSSANYFTKCFKKMFHQLPSTYQASEAGEA